MENIRKQINDACMLVDSSEVAKRMGYTNVKKCEARIQYVLNSPDFGLIESNFDGIYSSEDFFNNLLKVVGLGQLIYSKELQDLRTMVEDERWGFRPWIFVDTNFKRKNQPIFVLAFSEGVRRFALPKKLKSMRLDEQCEYLRAFISKYLVDLTNEHQGELAIWGKPVSFHCHVTEDHVLKFDLDGNLIENIAKNVDHGMATISL